ncbi:MAG: hypothetical protein CMF74_02455 [Maricaulis sp.]|jgi:hypothetical protein|nr:hypothetical protein [Maricaulis sp.]HAQ35190.1 hypothetical protein [Alphaproteobacteria bacterium]|tara:strand:- start:996 stop:1571 length:576 start_codon:yes stop_codon:yes gene_type:complete
MFQLFVLVAFAGPIEDFGVERGTTLEVRYFEDRQFGNLVGCTMSGQVLVDDLQAIETVSPLLEVSIQVLSDENRDNTAAAALIRLRENSHSDSVEQPLAYAYFLNEEGRAWPAAGRVNCASSYCVLPVGPSQMIDLMHQLDTRSSISGGYTREDAVFDTVFEISAAHSRLESDFDPSEFLGCVDRLLNSPR